MKKRSIKIFWVSVAIALVILLLLVNQCATAEKFATTVTMVEGFIIGFVTYAIATKLYTL